MTAIQAIILGIIQGLTEFLPVSSSGHLELAQHLFGLDELENFLFFDLVCHLGTLSAITAVYNRRILELFFSDRKRLYQLLIAIIPLFFLLPVMSSVEALFGRPQYLGFFFLVTALLLFCGEKIGRKSTSGKPWLDALVIGTFQVLAILPGVSRSGSTISAARMLGWKSEEAVAFSFLLAIPTILGGTIIHCIKLLGSGRLSGVVKLPIAYYFYGFVVSAVVGYASLRLLILLAVRYSLLPFAGYCAAIGIFCLFYLNNFV